MATTDGGETDDDGPDWERIARHKLTLEVERLADDANAAAYRLAHAVENATATADDVTEFRMELEGLVHTIEEDIASIVDGVEPYESNLYLRDTGHACDFLDITVEQVNEVTCGARIELGATAIQELCNGHSVQVETPAGIEFELAPKSHGHTETGP